ncbi:hypothetical protein ACHAWU_006155 [Discostella pseudostelligera]|uniref:Uncharacterized protein n=1 Tax=Discostella pseudostelligera TaxID=259834 RepID=A0ABD3M2K7_9STRA
MEPDEENVYHNLCSKNERLMKEMNAYLASISSDSDVSIKATSEKVTPENEESFDDDEGVGTTRRKDNSYWGAETDEDSLVAMARHMDAASIISDPFDKSYHAQNVPLSPRMEIIAGMEEMLAQFTNSDPSITNTTVQERFNNSDPSITTRRSVHSQHVPPPLRSHPKQMNYSQSTSPITPKFAKKTSNPRMTRDQSAQSTSDILPFPNFGNFHEGRRLSLGRILDTEASAIHSSFQQDRQKAKSATKYKSLPRGKEDVITAKPVNSPPSTYSKRESTGSKGTDSNLLLRKGWHKKQHQSQDKDSDDEMCGVGINTRVHDEKLSDKKKSKNGKEKKYPHTEKRRNKAESKLTNNTQTRPHGESSSRRGVERSDQSKSHSEKRQHHKTHRRTRTSQSSDNLDTERLPNRAKSSSPRNSRRLSSKGRSVGSTTDNHSTYDSDDETQFFYESTDDDGFDDEDDELDSEDELKAVGTSVVDAVKDLNDRSAVAKVKNLFKLHH